MLIVPSDEMDENSRRRGLFCRSRTWTDGLVRVEWGLATLVTNSHDRVESLLVQNFRKISFLRKSESSFAR